MTGDRIEHVAVSEPSPGDDVLLGDGYGGIRARRIEEVVTGEEGDTFIRLDCDTEPEEWIVVRRATP